MIPTRVITNIANSNYPLKMDVIGEYGNYASVSFDILVNEEIDEAVRTSLREAGWEMLLPGRAEHGQVVASAMWSKHRDTPITKEELIAEIGSIMPPEYLKERLFISMLGNSAPVSLR